MRNGSVVRLLVLMLVALVALVSPGDASAEPIDPKVVPPELKPWVPWVLDGQAESLCPVTTKNGAQCAWPSRVDLVLDEKSGKFSQKWHMEAAGWVPLPGDAKRWPLDVKNGAQGATVIERSGAPHVRLEKGDHVLTGTFQWDTMPESIAVPKETGLLSLSLRGTVIASPNRDPNGTVWLQKAAKNEEGDALEIVVHRKVTDDIPLRLVTRIEVHASGKNREELLGRALPDGFSPLALESPIPARVEPDGHVRVQVRPGVFTVELTARFEGPATKLTRPKPNGPWREGDEVWVFEAKNDYRVVNVEGVPSIDPAQTTLPEAWKRLPAYPMKLTDTFSLVERRRGDADPPENQLALERKLWLDFDGKGLTASDRLTGTLSRDSRLTMAEPTVLGRVSIGGRDQFITKQEGLGAGVEIRQGQLSVDADSRIASGPSDVPAVSWAHDFHRVHAWLNLPPGYRLLHATGVDEVSGTWVKHWSLLELFLALVLTVAIGRLYGPRWGALALVLYVLTFPEHDAPKWVWFPPLACEAIFRALPVGRAKKVFEWARTFAVAVVALVAVPFLVQHVREGAFPALAEPNQVSASAFEDGSSLDKEGGTGTRAKGEEGSMGNPNAFPVAPAAPPPPPAGAAVGAGGKGGELSGNVNDIEVAQAQATQQKTEPKKPAPRAQAGWDPTSSVPSRSSSKYELQSNAMEYDPAAIVQTGPGLPRWSWTSLELKWSGPVSAAQRLHLYLLGPREGFALAILRALLLLVVFARLFPLTAKRLPKGWGPAVAAGLVLALVGVSPAVARAEMPSNDTLEALKKRLVDKPSCSPDCATSGRMAIEVRGDVLRARLEVDAAATAPFALPGSIGQFSPRDVLVDGQPAKALARGADGVLYVLLAPGKHQVVVEGALPERESVQLALPEKPHRIEASAEGWTVEGIHEDGLADDNLQFTRKRTQGPGATLQPGQLPPFVRVERTLRVGLNWQVDTKVVRVSPLGSAVVLEVPLLLGENVTTADVRVVSGKALVNMGPQVKEVAWQSVLEQKSPVKLVAPKGVAWTEVWRLDVGPIWHAKYGGIPFVHTQPVNGVRTPEFRPWPGEEATVELTRPEGVPGQTLTIDEEVLDVRPGIRTTDVKLTLTLRSSRGAQHTVTLPDGATLESLLLNGATQSIRQEGRKVTFPVSPGAQTVVVSWREEAGISSYYRVSTVDVGAPSVNARVNVSLPGGRWLLFAGGPRLGPAVLFWSLLAVLLVVAVVLGRNEKTPLKTWHWLLLAVGLSQVPIVLAAFFVAWLLALGYRKESDGASLSPATFNVRQVGLVLLTLVAMSVLFASIYKGLLGDPEMQVRGNGSSLDDLRWFQDRSEGSLPTPWVLSVPILVYRGLMLAWALWTALAIVSWLKWGWGAFGVGGMWKPFPKPAPRPVPGWVMAQGGAPYPGAPAAPNVDPRAAAATPPGAPVTPPPAAPASAGPDVQTTQSSSAPEGDAAPASPAEAPKAPEGDEGS